MDAELVIENLKANDILKEINLNLKGGTIAALIGNSNIEKTILLKSIFGLIKYHGNIKVNGVSINEENVFELRKNIGIFLETNEFENKNVILNIMEPLKNLGYQEEEARNNIYEIAKKLDIENLLYKKIETLSYSQKKIVAFARSIIHLPNIILIDNLFESIDLHFKNKIISYLNKLKKTKKVIILFTSNFPDDQLLADKLILLKNGMIVCSEDTKKLMEDEALFIKNKIKLPFIVDLSHKLKSYNLIDKIFYDMDEMVDEIWK